MTDRRIALINGNVLSRDGPFSAIVIVDNRIEYVGDSDEALEIAGRKAKVIDLKGRFVLPGFIDAHMHLMEYSLALKRLDLRGVHSILELKRRVAEKAKALRPGEWILGRGWDQELFVEGRWPSRFDLDEAAPNNPVLLRRICGHIAVANSKALRLAGIDRETPDPPGGEIDRDPRGMPTGILKETAIELVERCISPPSERYRVQALIEGMHSLLTYGITTVHIAGCTKEVFGILKRLLAEHRLPIRVRVYFSPRELSYAIKMYRATHEDTMLRVMGVKVLADGSLGGRTAYLRRPYNDHPGRGFMTIDKNELSLIVEEAMKNNIQVAVHAIGDAAIGEVLDSYEKAGVTFQERFRIEHASVSSPDLIETMKRIGIVAVVQPHFVISDWWIVDRLGEERATWAYPFKTLLKRGIHVAFSTDAPVEPVNPWLTLYAAISRGEPDAIPLALYTQHERLDLHEALRCYTYGSAYAAFDETLLGDIAPGKLADLVVIDKNPFTLPAVQLKNIKVFMTIVNGKIVYTDPKASLAKEA